MFPQQSFHNLIVDNLDNLIVLDNLISGGLIILIIVVLITCLS